MFHNGQSTALGIKDTCGFRLCLWGFVACQVADSRLERNKKVSAPGARCLISAGPSSTNLGIGISSVSIGFGIDIVAALECRLHQARLTYVALGRDPGLLNATQHPPVGSCQRTTLQGCPTSWNNSHTNSPTSSTRHFYDDDDYDDQASAIRLVCGCALRLCVWERNLVPGHDTDNTTPFPKCDQRSRSGIRGPDPPSLGLVDVQAQLPHWSVGEEAPYSLKSAVSPSGSNLLDHRSRARTTPARDLPESD